MVYFGHPFILMGVTGSGYTRLSGGYLIALVKRRKMERKPIISYKSNADDIKTALLDGLGRYLGKESLKAIFLRNGEK